MTSQNAFILSVFIIFLLGCAHAQGQGLDQRIIQQIEKAGWTIDDLDLVEANEAFAAQTLAVGRDMGWDADRVNVNGGAIIDAGGVSCGHRAVLAKRRA